MAKRWVLTFPNHFVVVTCRQRDREREEELTPFVDTLSYIQSATRKSLFQACHSLSGSVKFSVLYYWKGAVLNLSDNLKCGCLGIFKGSVCSIGSEEGSKKHKNIYLWRGLNVRYFALPCLPTLAISLILTTLDTSKAFSWGEESVRYRTRWPS